MLEALVRSRDHVLRGIAAQRGDTLLCEKECIFPRAAVELKDVIAAMKCLSQHLPDGVALRAPDEAIGQFRPADEADATGRGVLLEKFLIGEAFEVDDFRHGVRTWAVRGGITPLYPI